MSEQKDKGTLHLFATLIERGGRVSTASEFKLCGLGVARVGDVVTYPDGSEAIIVDGAGYGCLIDNRAAALVAQRRATRRRLYRTQGAEMQIPEVRFGDPTTTGGKVHAFHDNMKDDGKAIALHCTANAQRAAAAKPPGQ